MATYLIIPDLHFPYAHKVAVNQVVTHAYKWQPDYIIQLGDLYDFFSFSRFRKPCLINPPDEVRRAREMAEDMWSKLVRVSPNSVKYQMLGNHDVRPFDRLLDAAPEMECFIDFKSIFEFDRVKTIHDSRELLILNGISFMHGYQTRPGAHAKYNLTPTVCAHSHVGYTLFLPHHDLLWELNAGFLGDKESGAMNYTKQRQFSKWTLGFGWIDNLGPRFIPL